MLQALGGTLSGINLSEVVGFGVRGVADASRAMALVLRLGEWLFSLGRSLSEPLLAPQAMAALAVCLLVSGLAFRFSARPHLW